MSEIIYRNSEDLTREGLLAFLYEIKGDTDLTKKTWEILNQIEHKYCEENLTRLRDELNHLNEKKTI